MRIGRTNSFWMKKKKQIQTKTIGLITRKMLTTHFGKTNIRKQEMYGTVEVSRSFVHRKYYYKQILSFMFCLSYIWTTLFPGSQCVWTNVNLHKSSTQIADFLGKWILRGIRLKNVFLFACLCKTNYLPPPPLATNFPWYHDVNNAKKKTLHTLRCFNTRYNFTNGF